MPFEPITLPAIDPFLLAWVKGMFIGAIWGVMVAFVVVEIQARRLK